MLINAVQIQQSFEPCGANVGIKFLNENAKMPTRSSDMAAGWDLYAATTEPIDIAPHSTVKVGTGLSMQLPDETVGLIFARSGLASKKGLRPANCVGVCDADYRGEYIVALHNDTDEMQSIEPGDRIAQLIIVPFYPIVFNEMEELEETERGDGGFGSTGAN